MPLSISEAGTRPATRSARSPASAAAVTLKDLAIFARQFATMTSSGLSLLRSLAILEEQTEQADAGQGDPRGAARHRGRHVAVGSDGQAGQDLPALMVAMINAGETGGFLDSALDRIAINFEKDANLRAKIKSAMTYPVIVLVLQHRDDHRRPDLHRPDLREDVPAARRQAAAADPDPGHGVAPDVLAGCRWSSPSASAARSASGASCATTTRGGSRSTSSSCALPVFGSLFTKIAISRFSRNLGTLLAVGVPVMQALDVVGGTTGNAVIGEAMKDVQKSVRDGQPMSAPLVRHPIFPPMVTQMMEVGEETGQISAMLDKVADFYDHEVETATESLTAAIEPVMVVVMGAIIGTMVICLYLPMFTIYQHIQGAHVMRPGARCAHDRRRRHRRAALTVAAATPAQAGTTGSAAARLPHWQRQVGGIAPTDIGQRSCVAA